MIIKAYHIPGAQGGYCLNQPDRGVWESCEINIPDEIIQGYNVLDELIVQLGNQPYALGMVLSDWGGKPCLRWYDGAEHRMML